MKRKAKPGRPPSGTSETGRPEKISDYPKLTITMKAATKAQLEAMRSMLGLPAWKIIEDALTSYFETLPAKDRKALAVVSERIKAHDAAA